MNMVQLMRSKHIVLLFFIFLVLSTFSSFLWLMSDALKRNFNFTASEVLGADGSIESNQILPTELNDIAKKYPIKLSETKAEITMAAPKLGEHSEEILKGLGYAESEIQAMKASGTIG